MTCNGPAHATACPAGTVSFINPLISDVASPSIFPGCKFAYTVICRCRLYQLISTGTSEAGGYAKFRSFCGGHFTEGTHKSRVCCSLNVLRILV